MTFWQKIKRFLPKLMAEITGHDRYLPEFEWSNEAWTYNIFRLYELIFWRRFGIRAESAFAARKVGDKVIVTYQFFTVESFVVFVEGYIRQFLKDLKKIQLPIKVWIPQLSMAGGLPKPASPFLFAIAFDATSTSGFINPITTSTSFNHTVTGSNPYLMMGGQTSSVGGATMISGVTYNSAAMTSIFGNGHSTTSGDYVWHFYKANPSTGTHSITVSVSSNQYGQFCGGSYSGVVGTSPIDTSGATDGSGTGNNTVTLTVANANEWFISYFGLAGPGSNNPLGASGSTRRLIDATGASCSIFDDGPKSTGSQSIVINPNCSSTWNANLAALVIPYTVTTTVQTVTAKARIKTADIAKTVTAKARILTAGVAKTVTSKARIKQSGVVKTIGAKAFILGTNSKLLTAKARIFQPGIVKTVTSKARIKIADISKTVTAKARIKIAGIAKTITAKAHIHAPRRGFILMKNKDQTYKQSMSDNRIR